MKLNELSLEELVLLKSGLELSSKNLERLKNDCEDTEIRRILLDKKVLNNRLYKKVSDVILELSGENDNENV
jgi:hypothetical protein